MAGGRIALPRTLPAVPRVRWERAGLWAASAGAAVLLLLPVLYLLVRFAGAGPAVWSQLITASTAATLARTMALALAVTAAAALVALPAAWLTTRSDLPARRLLTVLLALPMVIPSYVGAYLLVAFLGPRGMLAQITGLRDVPSLYGFPGAFLALTLLCYPYLFLAARSALQGMDPALEEAARSLGSSPWAVFRKVTLPHLRPALAAGGLLVALYVLRDFGAVSILRYDTFTRVIYIQYQSAFDRQAASGAALLLVALTLALLALESRARGRSHYRRGTAARVPSISRLGPWRIPAQLFCWSIVALALILPVSVLTFWLARGLLAGAQVAPLWEPARNSLLVSALAAGLTLPVAFIPALLSARTPGRWSGLLYGLAYGGYALPGIVVALAVVFFGLRFAEPLYGSLAMMLLAYGILFAPQAMGVLRGAILQMPAHVEEAARGLGRSPLRVLVEVTLPLIRPGIRAGAALVFLSAMKELPATLILSPLGFETLAVDVWSAVSEAFFARAAAPALLLVLFSSVPAAFLMNLEQK